MERRTFFGQILAFFAGLKLFGSKIPQAEAAAPTTATLPAIPTPLISKDQPKEKPEWPKILACIDDSKNQAWKVGFHRELSLSSSVPFQKGKASKHEIDRRVLNKWLSFNQESVFLLRGVWVEPVWLAEHVKIKVNNEPWDKGFRSGIIQGDMADTSNLREVKGSFIPSCSALTIELDEDLIFPEDMDVIVTCDIAEYRLLNVDLTPYVPRNAKEVL